MMNVIIFLLGIFLMYLGWDFETVADILLFISGIMCWVIVAGPAIIEAID